MSNTLTKATVLVLNRNWQAINVRTPQDAFCMMATNVGTALEIEGENHPSSVALVAGVDADSQAVRIDEQTGSVRELRTAKAARREFERIATSFPGYRPKAARPYTARAIGLLVSRLARRAGLGRVHPHALRRAMACHMLASGANIRAIQELLGHERISTTTIYTHLTAQDLKKAHSRFHPHGDAHAEAE